MHYPLPDRRQQIFRSLVLHWVGLIGGVTTQLAGLVLIVPLLFVGWIVQYESWGGVVFWGGAAFIFLAVVPAAAGFYALGAGFALAAWRKDEPPRRLNVIVAGLLNVALLALTICVPAKLGFDHWQEKRTTVALHNEHIKEHAEVDLPALRLELRKMQASGGGDLRRALADELGAKADQSFTRSGGLQWGYYEVAVTGPNSATVRVSGSEATVRPVMVVNDVRADRFDVQFETDE